VALCAPVPEDKDPKQPIFSPEHGDMGCPASTRDHAGSSGSRPMDPPIVSANLVRAVGAHRLPPAASASPVRGDSEGLAGLFFDVSCRELTDFVPWP